MNDFILLMHGDGPGPVSPALWPPYLQRLRVSGAFQGGSAIGGGVLVKKGADAEEASLGVTGYIRVTAQSLEAALALVQGNPVYESGGTVEVRALPRD